MFGEFLQQGSVLSVVLMVYAVSVMSWAHNYMTPGAAPTLFHLVVYGSAPCYFWPAIYVGLYSGWVAGGLSFFLVFVLASLGQFVLRVPELFHYHFVVALIAYPIGYALSVWSLIG